MTVVISSDRFRKRSADAVANTQLQKTLNSVEDRFIGKRRKGVDGLPEFEALRDAARDIKDHTLAHLDLYLGKYIENVTASGGHVHLAATAEEACQIALKICQDAQAKTVTKGKSMISEEMGLNSFLEKNGIKPIETDLGEYIIQLRKEPPSHIIAPAVHLTKEQVAADFRRAHTHLSADRDLSQAQTLLTEARGVLREAFLKADVGFTGANLLIAETGSSVIVTNEGNGDLTQILPKTHVVLASIEKVVPTLEDASVLLRVLARSATGQEMSVYTTFSTGPRHTNDLDGPENYHVILLDNGRTSMLGSSSQDMLRCIRCGACMNHCPVYHAVGGHAYGSVYPGPMGSVLSPALFGVHKAAPLPNASTFCGRCKSVCPVRIPLPKLMRHWREREFERKLNPFAQRYGLKIWAWLSQHPLVYKPVMQLGMKALHWLGRKEGHIKYLPMGTGWTQSRDFPAPQKGTFQSEWKKRPSGKNHE